MPCENTYNIDDAGLQGQNLPPAFQFSVLTCKPTLRLVKTVYLDGEPRPYDNAGNFLHKYCEVDSLEDFAKALGWLADQPRMAIIRGQLKSGLEGWQPRRFLEKPLEPATVECPPRRWIVLDIDGVKVPHGLGSPDKLAAAGLYIRDTLLSPEFRAVRGVASATASTGLEGPSIARLRLFFALTEAADNDTLYAWVESLAQENPKLHLDPAPMRAVQFIYSGRPLFVGGAADPVSAGCRVLVLDGCEDAVALDLSRVKPKPRARNGTGVRRCDAIPDWMVDMAAADAGKGVTWEQPTEASGKAWTAIKRIFEVLNGCPKAGEKPGLGGSRHYTLNACAWELARLVVEGELPEALAREAFGEASDGINDDDGKYDADLIQRHIDDAFADVGGR